MRWEDLFADLEGQARSLESDERAAEIAELARGETARVALVDRLRAQVGRPVALDVAGVGEVVGRVTRVGPDHLLLDADGGSPAEALVSLHAVLGVLDLAPGAVPREVVGVVESRLGLGSVLRGVAADRSPVLVTSVDGTSRHGTLTRVGADWLDLAEHAPGEAPRGDRVRLRTMPFTALAGLRRTPTW